MTQEERNELLEKAYIPEEWKEHCYITEEKMIFTPRFDEEGVMVVNGEEAYNQWLEQKNNPPVQEPTAEERAFALEQQLADLEIEMLQ